MKHFLLTLILMLISPIVLFGQSFTLDEFLDLLKDTHPVFREKSLAKGIIRQEATLLSNTDDWMISSKSYVRYERPAINFAGPDRMQSIVGDIGVSKTFQKNGSHLSAYFKTGYYDFKIDPGYQIPSALQWNQFYFAYSIPLLRNRNGFLDRLQYQLKQYDIDITEIVETERCEDFLYMASLRFLQLSTINEQIGIAQKRQDIAKDELDRITLMNNAGLVDKVDVIRARNSIINLNQNMALYRAKKEALQAELAHLTNHIDLTDFKPVYDLYQTHYIPCDSVNISKIITNSRLIVPFTIQLSQINHYEKGLMNQRKPDLSAYGSLGIEKIDSNVIKSLPVDKPTLEIGVNLSLPLENKQVKLNLELNELRRNHLLELKESTKRDLISSLMNLTIQLNKLKEVLNMNRQLIESSYQKTLEEKKLYDAGRGDLNFVIQSRDDEMKAFLILAENAYYYQSLYIEYLSLLDELYPQY